MILDQARSRQDLRVPPGNGLEALKGDRAAQNSIRIHRRATEYRVVARAAIACRCAVESGGIEPSRRRTCNKEGPFDADQRVNLDAESE